MLMEVRVVCSSVLWLFFILVWIEGDEVLVGVI